MWCWFFQKLLKGLLAVWIFLARERPISVKNSLNVLAISISKVIYSLSIISLQGSFDLLYGCIFPVHAKTTYEWHTDEIRVHTSDIRMIYESDDWHMDEIRVHTSDIRMTNDYIQVIYGWHTSKCEWHMDDIRVHMSDIPSHTNTCEWHTDGVQVHTTDIWMT